MAWQTFTLSFDLVQWWIPNVLTAIQVEPEFLKKYEQKNLYFGAKRPMIYGLIIRLLYIINFYLLLMFLFL